MAQGTGSRRGISAAVTAALISCAGPGCGSGDDAVGETAAGSAGMGVTGGSGGTAGTSTGGSSGTGTGGSSGTSTGGTAGTGTGGSAGATDAGAAGAGACASGWGSSQELMRFPKGAFIRNPALGPDELEVLYGHWEQGPGWDVRRSVRDSLDAPFPAGQVVAELGGCDSLEQQSIDLSADGLTVYMTCYSRQPQGPVSRLLVARRPGLAAGFAFDPQGYGHSGLDFSVGADELVAYASTDNRSSPVMFTRPTKSAAFGPSRPVPGLEPVQTPAGPQAGLGMPTPSSDDLWLFGVRVPTGVFQPTSHIVVAGRARPDAPFGTPALAIASESQEGQVASDPAVSRDCRRLYYLGLEPPDHTTTTLRVARR